MKKHKSHAAAERRKELRRLRRERMQTALVTLRLLGADKKTIDGAKSYKNMGPVNQLIFIWSK